MQTFPDVYARRYISGGLPSPRANDLNRMQFERMKRWFALRGQDLVIGDDFTGDALDRSLWIDQDDILTNISLIDDAANDGWGTLALVPGSNGSRRLTTGAMNFSHTNDFRASIRARFPTLGSATNGAVRLGMLAQFIDDPSITFEVTPTSVSLRVGTNAYLTSYDPALLINRYRHFEIRRTSPNGSTRPGYLAALINGSVIYEQARFDPPAGVALQRVTWFGVESTRTSAAGQGEVYLDSAKLWVGRRDPIVVETDPAPRIDHVEAKILEYPSQPLFVPWTTEFLDASYFVTIGVESTNGEQTTACLSSKAVDGVIVRLANPDFVGRIYIHAHT